MHGNNVNNLMSFPLSSNKIKMTFFAQPSLLLNNYFIREMSNFLVLLRHVDSTHSFSKVFFKIQYLIDYWRNRANYNCQEGYF